ncbi:hypothetical protein DRX19_29035 [Salmonella enterica subsp. enterica]|nr:hypothetical protein [Salmonella enterica subsp. enterica serovar Pensacola]
MKIFTTALIAFGSLTYVLTAHAAYHSVTPEFPTGHWSLAVIGCAHDLIGMPPRTYDIYSAAVIELTVSGDKSGRLKADVTTLHDTYNDSLGPNWQAASYTPSIARDYDGQPPLDYDNFGAKMWNTNRTAVGDLRDATATVTSAGQLENTPGDHTRVVTVELAGVDPGSCSIRSSNLIRP